MHNSRTVFRLSAALGCALVAGCSSGGGGTAATGTSVSTVGSGTQTTPCCVTDTGIPGPAPAPAPATFGTAAPKFATAGGPAFDGTGGGYPSNVTFPMITTNLQRTSSALTAVGDPAATATVVNTSNTASTLQLTVPAVNLNVTLTGTVNLVTALGDPTYGYSYVVMGAWSQRANQPANTGTLQSSSAFVFGYETPAPSIPTTGTATFSGTAGAAIYKPSGTNLQETYAEGSASLSANFASSGITGSFTKMLVGTQPWNDVSVTASIVPGTNRFNGTAAATSAPGTTWSLSGSATGNINGAFYGPAAQNLGAVWSLSDGTGSALGTVVGH